VCSSDLIYEVMALMTDSETAVRGYMLWKDPAYLAPYNHARSRLALDLRELTNRVQNNAGQRDTARELKQEAYVHLDYLRDMLNNPAQGVDPNSALTTKSRVSMEKIRSLVSEMETAEEG